MKIAAGFVLGVFVTLVVFMVVFCIHVEKRHPEILAYYQRAREQKNVSHRETYSWGFDNE